MTKSTSISVAVAATLCLMNLTGNSVSAKGLDQATKANQLTPSYSYSSKKIQQSSTSYLVMFKPETKPSQIAAVLDSVQAAGSGGVTQINQFSTIKAFSAELSNAQVEILNQSGYVLGIEANQDVPIPKIEMDQEPFSRYMRSIHSTNGAWGIDRIDQSYLPLDGLYQPHYDGAGANVYVLSSGINTSHQEFGGRASWAYTASTVKDGNDDGNGQGTHMAATIAGATYGVARAANLHAVKVMDNQGFTSTVGLVEGLDWVAKHSQAPAVAVLSLTTEYSPIINAAINALIQTGVTVVVPGGEIGSDACDFSPASSVLALTVAPTRDTDQASPYASSGACIDLYAPGLYIKSAWNGNDFGNDTMSHSPMASAHVAGAAAIIRANSPMCSPGQVKSKLLDQAQVGVLSNVTDSTANRFVSVSVAEDAQAECSVLPTCRAILQQGLSYGDGMYFIDPDGEGVGVDPFEVYCDMTTEGGGWTLFSHHTAGNALVDAMPVKPGVEGTLNDARWYALRSTFVEGMMFIDDAGKVSKLSSGSLWSSNCVSIGQVFTLLNNTNTYSWGRIWHDEVNCYNDGVNYGHVTLGPNAVHGAALYNQLSRFSKWPYSDSSSVPFTRTLSYFIQ